MKVLLKKDIDNLGYAGEVHDVAAGYGRNFLLPKGLAVRATPQEMKQAEAWRKAAEARRAELRAEYEVLSKKIAETTLSFTARAGETGKLYGSVTTAQIADMLNEVLGTEIDRRKVGVEPLRQLGEHKVVVRLSHEFKPSVHVLIESEEEEEEVVVEVETEEAAEDFEFDADETDEIDDEAEEYES